MTPFGQALRDLRRRRGVTQRQLAHAIGVSAAYLSALEHGKKGRPTFDLLQRITGYFHIIWDEAEELFRLAGVSDPKVVLDTSGLAPAHTRFANRLACQIRFLAPEVIEEMEAVMENTRSTAGISG